MLSKGFLTIALASSVAIVPLGALHAQSRWCTDGSVIFITGMAGGPRAEIAEVMRVCKPGDTIAIPGSISVAIGQLCDFSKPIVTPANAPVVCVIRNP